MNDLLAEALVRFGELYARAMESGLPDANAMTVSTVGSHGRPSSRVVLLKAHDVRGFVFYTNYESRKGDELIENRLHERTLYCDDQGQWRKVLLYP